MSIDSKESSRELFQNQPCDIDEESIAGQKTNKKAQALSNTLLDAEEFLCAFFNHSVKVLAVPPSERKNVVAGRVSSPP